MTISITTQSTEIPKDLPAYDFGFSVDYVKNVGSARRSIGATYRFIKACETLFIKVHVSPEDLIDSIQKFESIKELLIEGDKAIFILKDETQIPIVQSSIVEIEDLRKQATRETHTYEPIMILTVRKPDYLGNSQWQFHHNNKNFMAPIEHKDWLLGFQNRKFDVRPEDALRCVVKIEQHTDIAIKWSPKNTVLLRF